MIENLGKEFDDLKKLLSEDGEDNNMFMNSEMYSGILESLGVSYEELQNQIYSKVDLEYTSETEKELSYSYSSDSGFDLYSSEEIEMGSFGRALIPTGVRFNLPPNYEIQVRSKSGLAINQGLMVLNSPGTVDEGYTGEIKVILFNTNNHPVTITKGMKVAQCVIASCISGKYVNLIKVNEIKPKDRNENGFGSTGI
jgi:dUTP pyrophosphatase